MTTPKPELFLITGIPGTGKTCYGNKFGSDFGFVHRDIEDPATAQELCTNPTFIEDLTVQNTIVTWGFDPQDPVSLDFVRQFRQAGFKLIWFDGNRPAALREFQKRGTVTEEAFYVQMYRIEHSGILARLGPIIINPFDPNGQFKATATLLEEMRRK